MTGYNRKIIVLHIDTSLLRMWYATFTHSYVENIYHISCISYVFGWVVYHISPNVSNNVQSQSNMWFYSKERCVLFGCCHFYFWGFESEKHDLNLSQFKIGPTCGHTEPFEDEKRALMSWCPMWNAKTEILKANNNRQGKESLRQALKRDTKLRTNHQRVNGWLQRFIYKDLYPISN